MSRSFFCDRINSGTTTHIKKRNYKEENRVDIAKKIKNMTEYIISRQGGQKATATSFAQAKRIARTMCSRNVGASSNMMTSGKFLPAKRLYWQTWIDGTVVGDHEKNYEGDNPVVCIIRVEPQ